jgi:hypothetical protein
LIELNFDLSLHPANEINQVYFLLTLRQQSYDTAEWGGKSSLKYWRNDIKEPEG